MKPVLPTDQDERNEIPLADGCLYYFPNALAEIAKLSKIANEQHNPGEPMHWARNKSTDHANKILKHQVDAGLRDKDGTRHSAKVAWRALAQLEDELIAAGATPGRNAIGSPSLVRPPRAKPYPLYRCGPNKLPNIGDEVRFWNPDYPRYVGVRGRVTSANPSAIRLDDGSGTEVCFCPQNLERIA